MKRTTVIILLVWLVVLLFGAYACIAGPCSLYDYSPASEVPNRCAR